MSSLLERIAQAKRQQAAARAGEAAGPAAAAVSDEQGASAVSHAGPSSPATGAGPASDFEALLQIIGQHYQYDQDDFSAMRALQADTSEVGMAELARTIHEWRLELVAQGLTDQLDDGAAQRCWQALGNTAAGATPAVQPRAAQPPRSAMPAL